MNWTKESKPRVVWTGEVAVSDGHYSDHIISKKMCRLVVAHDGLKVEERETDACGASAWRKSYSGFLTIIDVAAKELFAPEEPK